MKNFLHLRLLWILFFEASLTITFVKAQASKQTRNQEFAWDTNKGLVSGVCGKEIKCEDGFDCVPLAKDASSRNNAICQAKANARCPASSTASTRSSSILTAAFHPSCCKCLIDLVYVIDRSGSMTHWNAARWDYVIRFLIALTKSFDAIAQDNRCVRIAIASLQGTGTGHLALTSNYATVINVLNNIVAPPSGPPNDVVDGMNEGQSYFGTVLDRNYAPNVMLVISDLLGDISSSPSAVSAVQAASFNIRKQGTCIHAVAVHNEADADSSISGNPFPDLLALKAITGNIAYVWHREHNGILGIVTTVRTSLCKACDACKCPRGYTLYGNKCYRLLNGLASWFHGFCKCENIGATFATNPAAIFALYGNNIWVNLNSPVYWWPWGWQYCMATNTYSFCQSQKRIACVRPCNSFYPTRNERERAEKGANKRINTNGKFLIKATRLSG